MNLSPTVAFLLLLFSATCLVAETISAGVPDPGEEAVVVAALILGTREDNPPALPWFLTEFESDLVKIFGYNRYDLMNMSEKPFREHTSEWLIPSNDFQLKIDAKGKKRLSCAMDVGLFHHEKRVLQTSVSLTREKPLFIAGPQWGRGRLIIVLIVK